MKIKIELEVPDGKYCNGVKDTCDMLTAFGCHCFIFNAEIEQVENEDATGVDMVKCQQCKESEEE